MRGRRSFLTRAAALAGTGALLAAALAEGAEATGPDAGLITLCAEFIALERRIEALYPRGATPIAGDRERDGAIEAISDMLAPMVDRICALRATTLAGRRARGAVLVAWDSDMLDTDAGDSWDERLRVAVLRDLSDGTGVLA